jgi:hypothetical protein
MRNEYVHLWTILDLPSMPVPNLKTRDVFYVVCFAFYQLGRSITLDPRCFPSAGAIISINRIEKKVKTKWSTYWSEVGILSSNMT